MENDDFRKLKVLVESIIMGSYFKRCDTFPFERFSKTYSMTNENINASLEAVSLKNADKALCVASSGDHAFNLINLGIKDVDTFDINGLSEYIFLGLKRSMILKYSYEEYLDILFKILDFNTTTDELNEIILGLIPYMEKKHQIFWIKAVDYFKNFDKQYIRNYLVKNLHVESFKAKYRDYNNYLQDEITFNNFKTLLTNANITFKHMNIGELKKGKPKYDIIMLSNILDYFNSNFGRNWDYSKLQQFESVLESITKPGGFILLHYLYSNFDKTSSLMDGSNVTRNDLTDEEIIKINNNSAGIILKRKR